MYGNNKYANRLGLCGLLHVSNCTKRRNRQEIKILPIIGVSQMFSIKRIIHNIKRILAMANSLDALKAKADQINTAVDEAIAVELAMQASIVANTNTITAQTAQIEDLTNQVALLNDEKILSGDIDTVLDPIVDKIKTMIPETK